MKAVRILEHGGSERLTVSEIPVPEPAPGEVRLRMEAAGVNFIDVYHRKGLYQLELPATLGMEGAGVVEAVGADVTGWKPGDRAAWAMHRGSCAEYAVVPAWRLAPLPHDIDSRTAAAVMLQGMTAHFLALDTFQLGPGKTALIHAAAGGVGYLLVQIAKAAGARVIGTCSTEEKAGLAREAGADDVILYTAEDFQKRTREFTEGRGVDVVYDSVGKTTFEKSLDCLRPRGLMVLFGQSSGPVDKIDPQILNAKGSLYLTRPSLGHYTANTEEIRRRTDYLFSRIRSGALAVRIDRTFSFREAAAAHDYLEARMTKGKVLLVP